MMINHLKYYALTSISILALNGPILPPSNAFGIIPYLDIENALQVNFEPEIAIPDTRDPEILALIDKIAFCESSHNPSVEIIDTNGYYSRGVMQFQMRTFATALRDLGYAVGDHETLRSQMLDGEFAKQIAYEWVAKDFENVYHWSCYYIVT